MAHTKGPVPACASPMRNGASRVWGLGWRVVEGLSAADWVAACCQGEWKTGLVLATERF
eukprot:CAMPEP_0174358902 /NCGR_PEP_ID=MMETSP0811_2-20130205/45304_1 /TAXON_ID=73025 ORGANISM="Eutreptiella gymnastica-like, Strain CCMP1594" /NCGR_SAMPLE_ID=MMETSP0811_2 /ASSEMBLY_ACC=CAM_ASM_000667 /LENGTH=58 /DNA_ID=CAMNT_0015493083 /DNA_START=58 /DNA_END=234 /DNA_ORIENTATION=+